MNIKPYQFNSINAKKGEEWQKAVQNYYFSSDYLNDSYNKQLELLYQAACGKIDVADMAYILNPSGLDDPRLKNFPARLRSVDIISPIVQAFLGERSRMSYNYEVVVTNRDVITEKKKEINGAIMALVSQQAVNAMNAAGLDTGVPSKEVPSIQDLIQEGSKNYNDSRAMFGQEALDFIRASENLDDKYQRAFEDYIIAGCCYSVKDAYLGGLTLDIVSPLELKTGYTSTGLIEDCDEIVRYRYMSLSDIVDRFGREIEEKDLKKLQELYTAGSKFKDDFVTFLNVREDFSKVPDGVFTNAGGGFYNLIKDNGNILVRHATFKTGIKTGELTYVDMYGAVKTTTVDENYVLDKRNGDIGIEWFWDNQIYECYCIHDNIFTKARPLKIQRNDINVTSVCKQPYNGIKAVDRLGNVQSVVKKGIVYQTLTSIYKYKQELMINRNRDKLMLMPIGVLPDEFGSDPFDFFNYYADATGVGWFDESKPNAVAVLNAIKSIDLNLGNAVEQLQRVIDTLKADWWDSVGMNRQRFGESFASDGKAVTEQAIFRSSLITAELFRRFDKFVESDYQGLLDYSKLAWIEGKTGAYVNSDGKVAFFSAENSLGHLEACYNVFVKDSQKEKEDLDAIKQFVPQLAQKGIVPPPILANMVVAKNKSKLLTLMDKSYEYEKALEQSMAAMGEQNKKEMQAAEIEAKDKELAMDKYKVDVESSTEILVEKMKLLAQQQLKSMELTAEENAASEQTNEPSDLDVKKFELDKQIREEELALQKKKIDADIMFKNKDLQLKQLQHNDDVELRKKDLVIKNKKKVSK